MSQTISAGILGVGSYTPPKAITNFDLAKTVDTSDEWIVQRTGISERRILEKDQPAYEMGVNAAVKAMEAAGIQPEELELIIVSTNSPDYIIPTTACIIQEKIGAKNAAAFDMNAACTGFIYAMTVAKQFIATGCYRRILVIACEGLSKVTDWEDRNTCIIFADGAGAAILGPVEEGYGILATHLGADGTQGSSATLPFTYFTEDDLAKRVHSNKQVLYMNGSAIMKFAVRTIVHEVKQILQENRLTIEDIKYIIPHQANIRIIDSASESLGVKPEQMFQNIKYYGNISSASIPFALDVMDRNKLLSKGDNIILVGFGGGLTWGTIFMKWNKD